MYTIRVRVAFRTRVRERWRAWWWARENAALFRAFLETRPRRLHLGCGDNLLRGWLNTDLRGDPKRGVAKVDISRPLPFPDASCDLVFAEHLIEHISYQDACAFLRETRRVLVPGGLIRIATPDLNRIARFYEEGHEWYFEDQAWQLDGIYPGVPPLPGFMINTALRHHGHQFSYDAETLGWTLAQAGFVDLVERAVGVSDDADLRGIEGHGKVAGERANRFETLVMEARRPID